MSDENFGIIVQIDPRPAVAAMGQVEERAERGIPEHRVRWGQHHTGRVWWLAEDFDDTGPGLSGADALVFQTGEAGQHVHRRVDALAV